MKSLIAVGAALVLSGCYHVTVDTGRTPSGQTIEVPFAHSFIGGLVPPATVETASRCQNGVARVESQLSFLNMLVGGITFGLYTPMTITVQCAAAGAGDSAFLIRTGEGIEHAQEVLSAAANASAASGDAVLVRFE